jgi:hypothetical protein
MTLTTFDFAYIRNPLEINISRFGAFPIGVSQGSNPCEVATFISGLLEAV